MVEFHTVTAPAAWASALVNGDESGLRDYAPDADDIAAYETFRAELVAQGLAIVSTATDESGESAEPRFTWHGLLYGSAYAGCDVLDYIAHKITP